AHIRISHEADIGQQLQLQPKLAFFAGAPRFMLARRLVRRSGKLSVAASATSATRNHNAFIGAREIVHHLARIFVVYDRPNRHLQHDPFAVAPGFLRSLAVPSTLGGVFGIKTEMYQRVMLLARFHPDIAAAAAIAARRPASRNELLPPERHAAVAAISGLHPNFDFIDEHKKTNMKR